MSDLKHEFIQANGIRYHYVTAGKGPLVILLHGFPEFWYSWRHQMPVLASHFRVAAPDLRGYGETAKPVEVSDYQIILMAADIADLIKALGYQKAHIVGHDWGGAIAWRVALEHPEVVDRLAVLNCPHPRLFARAMRSNWRQMRRSWYMFFFQIPCIPELLFRLRTKSLLRSMFRGTSTRKDVFTDEDLEQYRLALLKPGVLTAALNYYRAFFRYPDDRYREIKDRKISSPALLIWGERDAALGKELTYGMEPFFSGPFKLHYLPNCSHWVNEEQPDLVNSLLLEFLGHSSRVI